MSLAWRRRLALSAIALTILSGLGSLALIVLGGSGPVPDNWGFRGYWVVTAFLFAVPGANLALRRPDNPIGWLLLWVGLGSGLSGSMQEYVTYGVALNPGTLPAPVVPAWIVSWFWLVTITPVLLVLLLFPDGRLPSPRWRPALWAVVGLLTVAAFAFAFRPGPLENSVAVENPLGATGALEAVRGAADVLLRLGFVGVAMLGGTAAVVRFRRARGDERQQLKWFAYAAGILAVTAALLIGSGEAKPFQIAMTFALGIVPISVAIAVLRYRLYDIDLLINRTIVYGALSAVLAAAYVAFVVLFQAVLRPITAGSEIAVAASTLAVVALVQPLRRRIQDGVDRRFYRSRYDAAQTLEAFAARLRDEVEIEAVRADLVYVIHEAIRPAHASVWLREGRS